MAELKRNRVEGPRGGALEREILNRWMKVPALAARMRCVAFADSRFLSEGIARPLPLPIPLRTLHFCLMSNLFLESPWLIGGIGFASALLAAYLWLQTGQAIAMRLAGAIVAITVILVGINIAIETEQEVVRRTLYQLAADLQANRFDKVVEHVHPDASAELLNLKAQVESVHFNTARIKTIHGIMFGPTKNPRTAVVRMNVVVSGDFSGMQGTWPRWVRFNLEQVDGKWLIVDYDHREPHYEMLNQDGRSRLDSFRRR